MHHNIQYNISLKPYNTFGIDVLAKCFANFQSEDHLCEILSEERFGAMSHLLLGGGSNVLFTKNFDGLVLKNEIGGIQLVQETDEHYFVKAGAGVIWHDFVLFCIRNAYAGVENLALIPGCVGASPMQNIGAYGVEIKNVFHSLEAIHLHEKNKVVFANADCAFGYRESVFKNKFKNQFAITSVTFQLDKKPSYHIEYGAIQQELERMGVQDLSIDFIAQAVMNIRNSKLPNPREIGNAGSFFKNPEVPFLRFSDLQKEFPNIIGHTTQNGFVKLAAGWMIEQCGWKGYRNGDAGCHIKQALVVVNHAEATGTQILELSNQIISSVQQKFGVLLEREVNIL